MIKRMIAIAAIAAVVLAVFSVGDTAQADGEDYAALKKLITENRVGERVKLDANDKLTIPTDPKGGVAYRLESVDVDGSTGAMTTTSHGVARFHLPATDAHENKTAIDGNGIAIYAGTSYHIALDAAQDGFSAYVAVNDSAAPTRYEFDYDLPSGFKLSEDGAGGIEILDSENEVVGDIAPPWAVDANGASVRTAFKLVGDALVQTIQHSGAAYPVVADPRITYGWAVFLRWDLTEDNMDDVLDDADTWLENIKFANCGTVGAGLSFARIRVILLRIVGGPVYFIYCLEAELITRDARAELDDIEDDIEDAIEDARLTGDEYESPLPDDCTLMIRLMYLGALPSRVELEDCGEYSGEYFRLLSPPTR